MKPLLLVAALALVLFVAWGMLRGTEPTDAEALAMCGRFAAERFRLPASARHAGFAEARITRSGDTFTVSGWSDTPERRIAWTCTTRPSGGDRWELVGLI